MWDLCVTDLCMKTMLTVCAIDDVLYCVMFLRNYFTLLWKIACYFQVFLIDLGLI